MAVVASGAIARTVAVVAMSPMELIRTKMQSERISFVEVSTKLKGMIKSQGIGSLYMGEPDSEYISE